MSGIKCSQCQETRGKEYYKFGVKISKLVFMCGEEIEAIKTVKWICEPCVEIQGFDWELEPKLNFEWDMRDDKTKRDIMGFSNARWKRPKGGKK